MNRRKSQRISRVDGINGVRFGLVVSSFNKDITAKLLRGARACLSQHGVDERYVRVYSCPGAFELPQVAEKLFRTNLCDVVICLGAVIRGQTPHFHFVSSAAAHGIEAVAMKYSRPVAFGVLTTDTLAQANARAGGRHGNKGRDAALAAIEMASMWKKLRSAGKRKR